MKQTVLRQASCRFLLSAMVLSLLWLSPLRVQSAPPPRVAHSHEPIDVPSRPIVSRMKLPLVHPRRLLVDSSGNLLIADWGAGAVLSIDSHGGHTVLASGLDEPAGLACDAEGNVYISTHSQGVPEAGSIIRVTPAGEQSLYAAGLTGPTALAFDARGILHVANFHDDSVSRISADGEPTEFAVEIPQPSALVFDEAGMLYVASSTMGTVYSVSPHGDARVIAMGFSVPSDLSLDPDGHLIIANYNAGELTYLQGNGRGRRFATVPKGTIGLVFDRDGNLLLANWDEPFVIKVTSKLTVPCPHCEKQIPVRLRGRPDAVDETIPDERLY